MLRTPTPRSGMPFFRPVESAARNLRPLADHRLVVSPLLAPAVATTPGLRDRLAGRSHTLLGGVAVLAVAGALSAGLGTSGHAAVAAAPSASSAPASSAAGFASLLAPAAFAAPVAVPAAVAAAVKPAAKVAGSKVAGGKAHTPSLAARPHGASVVTHQDTVNVRAMTSELRKLRGCETGGNYREASGNGYYGAYQFDLSTWESLGLSGYPSNASHQLQDVAVVRLEAHRGWSPWPVCSYATGLR